MIIQNIRSIVYTHTPPSLNSHTAKDLKLEFCRHTKRSAVCAATVRWGFFMTPERQHYDSQVFSGFLLTD